MVDIDAKVTSLMDKSHYLYIAKNVNNNYYQDFLNTANAIRKILTEKDFLKWLEEKMLLTDIPFNEKKFIQYAVEASAARYFIEKDDSKVSLEKKINPNNKKDVDIQYVDGEYTYNIEIKCPTFDNKEKSENVKNIKIDIWGRLPDRGEEASNLLATHIGKDISKIKKMDCNLKDYLVNAHSKFNPDASDNELNVLLVGCDDIEDIQRWYGYMFADNGLLTKESFEPQENYNNVDAIVVTDRYYRHRNYSNSKIIEAWSFENGLSLVFLNPFRKNKKKNAMDSFLKCFHNYTTQFQKYTTEKKMSDIWYVLQSRIIPHFVMDNLKKDSSLNIYIENIEKNIAENLKILSRVR